MELSHKQPVLLDVVVLSLGSMDFSKFFIVMFPFGTYFIRFMGNVITVMFIPKSVMGIFKPWPLSIMCKYFGHNL